MKFPVRFVLIALLLVYAGPILLAQNEPRGIYAVVSVLDEISALQTANPSATQKEMDAGFDQFYQSLLEESAVAGLTLQVHWDTVNPKPPGHADSYFWNYVDEAFKQARIWNRAHLAETPKTIQLIMMPGFQSPQWLLADRIPGCNGLFHSPEPTDTPKDCGTVTFTGYSESSDSTTYPLPWNPVYKSAWRTFLRAVAERYGSDPLFVSIAVAGPTAASAEMIVPNDGNSDNPQEPDNAPISPSDMWLMLLQFHYQNQPAFQGTDQAFIDEWEDAIDMYASIFHGITLIVTTGNGFPNFAGNNFTVPPALAADCLPNRNRDCAAEATILEYFMQPSIGGDNAKASQTSGMVASHEEANMNDMGVPGVKQLSNLTEDLAWPSAQILGGSQFSSTFSKGTLKEGCTNTFPPNPNDPSTLPLGCDASVLSACLKGPTNGCIPVACIPQSCLTVPESNIPKADTTYGSLVNHDPSALIPPEQALYNVLNFYFDGTAAASAFGGMTGLAPAPMNYLQIYSEDIQYTEENASAPALIVEGSSTVDVTAQSLLDQASAQLSTIEEPPPSIISAGVVARACPKGEKIQHCIWISIDGNNLSIGSGHALKAFPTQLAGTSVTINGIVANLMDVSPAQIRTQVPNGLESGSVVVVTTQFGSATSKIE
ncbi:MAG: hypothetical protein WBP85_14625 [Terracidiphilus sp.]